MDHLEKRYEKQGQARPCFLDQDDLVNLARIVLKPGVGMAAERQARVVMAGQFHRVLD